jgi:hypothetical protein
MKLTVFLLCSETGYYRVAAVLGPIPDFLIATTTKKSVSNQADQMSTPDFPFHHPHSVIFYPHQC